MFSLYLVTIKWRQNFSSRENSTKVGVERLRSCYLFLFNMPSFSYHILFSNHTKNTYGQILNICSHVQISTAGISYRNYVQEQIVTTNLFVKVHGAFNKFPDFFVQAFKIVVDTWQFSMLLLYILWDDWPIFMISRSNEQLQQQLEYTILKPDCHC